MADIKHKIEINGTLDAVFRALSTIEGLAAWWTSTTTGDAGAGGQIDFRFGDHVVSGKVTTLETNKTVRWELVEANPDWLGTTVSFDLRSEGDKTVVVFGHRDWREANDFFGHCSMKWATFLLSLRAYIETGAGTPFPNDIPV